jgi:hypothetical protein
MGGEIECHEGDVHADSSEGSHMSRFSPTLAGADMRTSSDNQARDSWHTMLCALPGVRCHRD